MSHFRAARGIFLLSSGVIFLLTLPQTAFAEAENPILSRPLAVPAPAISPLAPPVSPIVRPAYDREEKQIPKKPAAPPALGRSSEPEAFHCERTYRYRGKVLACDSNTKQDAENLRPVLKSVPAAVSELNIYQSNRSEARSMAYLGSAGLGAAIAGFLASRLVFVDSGGGVTGAGKIVRIIGVVGGLGLASGALIYGLTSMRANESHLDQAVQNFNQVHPEAPVELMFSTTISF